MCSPFLFEYEVVVWPSIESSPKDDGKTWKKKRNLALLFLHSIWYTIVAHNNSRESIHSIEMGKKSFIDSNSITMIFRLPSIAYVPFHIIRVLFFLLELNMKNSRDDLTVFLFYFLKGQILFCSLLYSWLCI